MKINLRLAIILFSFFLYPHLVLSQSKFEFGIGFFMNASDIDEEILTKTGNFEESYKRMRQPAIKSRIGYKMTDRFHLNSGVGHSWLGALKNNLEYQITARTIEIPLLLEWNPIHYFHLSSGVCYNYITAMSIETEDSKSNILSSINTRHQIGLKQGIGVSHKLVEFSLSYTHYFSNLFLFPLFDINGNNIGTYQSKFKNIEFGVTIRR